jgi:hypothetical protein
MASKSAITFAISKGLERNKVFLRFLLSAAGARDQGPAASFLFCDSRELFAPQNCSSKSLLQYG